MIGRQIRRYVGRQRNRQVTEKKNRGWEGGGEKRRNGERKYINLITDLYLAYA